MVIPKRAEKKTVRNRVARGTGIVWKRDCIERTKKGQIMCSNNDGTFVRT